MMKTATHSHTQRVPPAASVPRDMPVASELHARHGSVRRKAIPAVLLLIGLAALSIAAGIAYPEEFAALMASL
ncbi:MAG TPA: hypothetical protein VEJ16_12790 [Alphaproteobacteria bacterium]|nr:hypothetical protein [Alphaproteobacteria bacterium]